MSNVKLITPCEKCNNDFELYYLGPEFSDETREKILCIDCLFTGDCGRWGRRYRCSDTSCKKCFYGSFASCEKSRWWDYERNEKSPREVTRSSNKKYWFKCDKCNHSFDSRIADVTKGGWCPYCSIPNKKLCTDDHCSFCYNRSFTSHEKANSWDYEKNEKTPREIAKACTAKYWFKCEKCNHGFDTSPDSIIRGSWCPYCGGKKLCTDDCSFCLNRSFASHEKACFWDYEKNNRVAPRNIAKNTHTKYWFKCQECKHRFDTSPHSITTMGSWCPYCCRRTLCNDHCIPCEKRSFASHEKSRYWDYNRNEKSPREVTRNSNKKYWFKCDKGKHEFDMSLDHIIRGYWCPKCKNKSERLFSEFLTASKYPHEHQARYDWCRNPKTGKKLPFDFCLEELNIIIEVDGPQHFRQISNWGDHKEIQERDRYKEECALERGYTIIRIYQPLILSSSTDWKETVKESLVLHYNPHIITIAEDGVYDEVL
jgi:YHS domain-containing protein